MSPASHPATAAPEKDPVITEADLAALDTSEGHADEAAPEEPINALAARFGAVVASIATIVIVVLVTVAVVMRYFFNS